jgi:hypothetical protein
MQITVTQTMADALKTLGNVPDTLKARFEAMTKGGGGYTMKLSEDDAMALAELVQWHMRTDPVTGKPTPESAPLGELIALIDEAQL